MNWVKVTRFIFDPLFYRVLLYIEVPFIERVVDDYFTWVERTDPIWQAQLKEALEECLRDIAEGRCKTVTDIRDWLRDLSNEEEEHVGRPNITED